MKKLSLLLAILLLSCFLFACGNQSKYGDVTTDPDTGDAAVDMDLVGAWKLEDEKYNEYYIFTEDCKIKIARGSVYFQGDALYIYNKEKDVNFLQSDFQYMYGTFSYTFKDDTVTFVDTEDGLEQTLVKCEYTPSVLTPYENLKTDENLIGTWSNEEYSDSYVFTADGRATYTQSSEEMGYTAKSEHVYTVSQSGVLLVKTDVGGGEMQERNMSYSIEGDKLVIEDAEFTRNNE